MAMSFHYGTESVFLFNGLSLDSYASLGAACFVVIVLGALTPVLYVFCSRLETTIWKLMFKPVRAQDDQRAEKPSALLQGGGTQKASLMWKVLYPTFIFISRVIYFTLGYILMLIAMTFNVSLFVSAVVGLALGTTIVKIFVTPERCYFRRTDIPTTVQEENVESGLCCC